nr:DNA primase [Ligilactobacillus ruminis]
MTGGDFLAGGIPEKTIDMVRSNADILDVVGNFVQMRHAGKNWVGLCPFHAEKTPSFSINEQKQFFYCFSCGRGGNVFKFIMELEDLNFIEAVYRVAELENIEIDPRYSLENQARFQKGFESSEIGQLKNLYKTAADVYHYMLTTAEIGEQALDYLHQRGLTDDLIEEFGLGFAPSQDFLKTYFETHGIGDYQLFRKSGLFTEHGDGSLVDRFHSRVMFPIRNASGQTIAFSGRLLIKDDKSPKYLNSPETLLFEKSKVLFNFDKAKSVIRRDGEVYLFEGFMDVLAAYRSGVKNGIASMGTSLTDDQIYQIEQITKKVLVCYDGDQPGQAATKRALDLFEDSSKIECEVVNLPEKLDPDEYVRKHGTESFKKIVHDNRETVLEFYMRYFKEGKNLGTESGQLAYITDVLGETAKISDSLQIQLTLGRLAKEFGIDKMSLESQLRVLKQQLGTKNVRAESSLKKTSVDSNVVKEREFSKIEKAERLLLHRILNDYSVYSKVSSIEDFQFVHVDYQALYLLIEGYYSEHSEYDDAKFLDYAEDSKLQNVLISIEMEDYGDYDEQEVDDCLKVLKHDAPLEEQIARISTQLDQAKRQNDVNKITELTIKYIKMMQEKQADA